MTSTDESRLAFLRFRRAVRLAARIKKPDKIGWQVLQRILPGKHRRFITNVLEMMSVRSGNSVQGMLPGTEGYNWVKAKYLSSGSTYTVRGIKGVRVMKGGSYLFIGHISGLGEVILAQYTFKI